jgi:pimeloyl-ACP methyl ester carboxylesterase
MQVDYGEQHALDHDHDRFGATFEGLFPEWSDLQPVHLVGHSYGGNTALELQRLLHEQVCATFGSKLSTQQLSMRRQAFSAHVTSASWVRSISTISSPLNGSLALYPLGLDEANPPATVRSRSSQCPPWPCSFAPWTAAQLQVPLSVGRLLSTWISICEFSGVRVPGVFNWGLAHWHLSWWYLKRTHPPTVHSTLVRACVRM